VFFYIESGTGAFRLLDGDKIACLFASELKSLLHALDRKEPTTTATPPAPSLPPPHHRCLWGCPSVSPCPYLPPWVRPSDPGVVQTAYANGASTAYLRTELGRPPGPPWAWLAPRRG